MTAGDKIDSVALNLRRYVESGWTINQLTNLLNVYCDEIDCLSYEYTTYHNLCVDIIHLAEWYLDH